MALCYVPDQVAFVFLRIKSNPRSRIESVVGAVTLHCSVRRAWQPWLVSERYKEAMNTSMLHHSAFDRYTSSYPAQQFALLTLVIMHIEVFATVFTAATAIAASIASEVAPYSWNVTNFNGTCSNSTCWAWGFSVSASGGPSGQPAFVVNDCYLDSRVVEYQVCRGIDDNVPGHVSVQIYDASRVGGLLDVQYTFRQ